MSAGGRVSAPPGGAPSALTRGSEGIDGVCLEPLALDGQGEGGTEGVEVVPAGLLREPDPRSRRRRTFLPASASGAHRAQLAFDLCVPPRCEIRAANLVDRG